MVPSTRSLEGCDCQICHSPIMPGEHVIHLCLDPFANGGPEFVTCCSARCRDHAIKDHGTEIQRQQENQKCDMS